MAQPGSAEPQYSIGMTYDDRVPEPYLLQRNHTGTAYVTWFLRKGHVSVRSQDRIIRASAGDWVIIDPLTTRSHDFSPDAKLLSIRFRVDWQGIPFIPPLREPRVYDGSESKALLEASEKLIEDQQPSKLKSSPSKHSDACKRKAALFEWLSHWHRLREESENIPLSKTDARIFAILRAIGGPASIAPLDYAQLSSEVGLSKAQLIRIFKANLGLTPQQWREAQCLKSAEDDILQRKLSVKEIAARLGFYDASHFTKWFRNKTGSSPRKWREQQTV